MGITIDDCAGARLRRVGRVPDDRLRILGYCLRMRVQMRSASCWISSAFCVLLLSGAAPAYASGARQAPPSDQILRTRLALRLVRQDQITAAQAVTRTVAPGIVAVAFDLKPAAGIPAAVGAAQLSEWRRSSKRVYALAERNSRIGLRLKPVETELDEGVLAQVFSGNDHAAVQAVMIAGGRVCKGREGALVIFPSNDYAVCYPIQNSEAERALQMLSVIAHRAFREHPLPLTDQVFWVRHGRWMTVPYEMKDDGYDYIGTPEFDRMLARLPLLADDSQ